MNLPQSKSSSWNQHVNTTIKDHLSRSQHYSLPNGLSNISVPSKTIFQLIAHHHDDFGITPHWNYLEAGHGKGPCDGLGASVKRGADSATKQGSIIQYTTQRTTSVTYLSVSKQDVKQSADILQAKSVGLHPVHGTF